MKPHKDRTSLIVFVIVVGFYLLKKLSEYYEW